MGKDDPQLTERDLDVLELQGPLPGRMTATNLQSIRTVLVMGGTLQDAAVMAGLTPHMLNKYLKEGQRLAEQGLAWRDIIEDGEEGIHKAGCLHLFEVVVRSRVRGKLRLVRKIQGAVDRGNWKASAWVLERRFPKEYGRQDRLTVTRDNSDPLKVVLSMDPAERAARKAELKDAAAPLQIEGGDNGSSDPGLDPGTSGELVPEPSDVYPVSDSPDDGEDAVAG